MNLLNLNTLPKFPTFNRAEFTFIDDFGWESLLSVDDKSCMVHRKMFITPMFSDLL